MRDDYLFDSKRAHWIAIALILVIACFLRWYRLDNCALCSGDEWLGIGPTFQFLDKFFENPITAIGFEGLAGVPFTSVGRHGPPFDYTRSLVLVWTMPYYGVISLFDFPVSEAWYRFPGTIWSLLGLASTYFFVRQATGRRVAALFAFSLQAALIGHLVQGRFLVADGVFMFWYPLAAGFWIQYLRDGKPRSRHWAYFTSMCYASSTPEAIIGLVAIFSLICLWCWAEGRIDPFRKPLAMLGELRRIFIAYPLLWLVSFYGFQVLVEVKLYIHDRDNFLNHANYLGRFFARGTGESGFYIDRVLNWYIYPHISAPLIVAAGCSLLWLGYRRMAGDKPTPTLYALLFWGWVWSAFWVVLTLLVSNSSSNFTRIMHAVLILGALGLLALYDLRPRLGTGIASGLLAANIGLTFAYPLLCPMPEDRNIAQAAGYLVQEYNEEWGGSQAISFYYPTGSLYAYIPEAVYPQVPSFDGVYTFDGCEPQTVIAASMEGIQVIISISPDYDMKQDLNRILEYAVEFDCEQARLQAVQDYALANGFDLVGEVVDEKGIIHANLYSTLPLDLGKISLEEANRLHYEEYSRRSWFNP